MSVREWAAEAKEAGRQMGLSSTDQRNRFLAELSHLLVGEKEAIESANELDLARAEATGRSAAFLARLRFQGARILRQAQLLQELAALADPLGQIDGPGRRPNGIVILRVRVPLGVIGIIYESRPNVTIEAGAMALKAGNGVLLRGGSEAAETNRVLVALMRRALEAAGLPPQAVQGINDPDRRYAREMMEAVSQIDLLIPRGGAGLIRDVVEHAKVPVLETGVGNCHVFVDRDADPDMATSIVRNAKCQNPSVCNAMETLLVDRPVAPVILSRIGATLREAGVRLRGCPETRAILPWAEPATEADWQEEYLDLTLAVRVVADLDQALEHIARYGSGHSEAIVTGHLGRAERFLREVDAAAVYVNASTRFTDGGEFGFGGEIGISTQKVHARGPVGLVALTSHKYIVRGEGQIRA